MTQTPRDWQKDMELCKVATKGPWREFIDSDGHCIGTLDINPQLKGHAPVVTLATSVHGQSIYISQNDSNFIIAAREALPYWLQEAKKWRNEVLRTYPTPEAYEAACAALDKHRIRADAAEAREQRLIELMKNALGSMVMIAGKDDEHVQRIVKVFRTIYPDTPAPKEGE